MDSKYFIALCLLGVSVALLFVGLFAIDSQGKEPEQKIVYVEKSFRTVDLENRLLAIGVSNAWDQTFGSNMKASCFQTELIAGDTIVTFCKLKKKLTS